MLERLAGRYPLETPTPTDPAQIRKDAEAEEEYLRKRFPDKVSPMAEALAKELGTQISPEDARRQAFIQAAIAGLGYQGRDFGAALQERWKDIKPANWVLRKQTKKPAWQHKKHGLRQKNTKVH